VTSFPGNPELGLPTVTGLVLLSDASNGQLVALFDAAAVTALRLPIHLADHLTPAVAALAAYQDGFLVAGIVALLAAVTSMVRGSARSVASGARPAEQQAIG